MNANPFAVFGQFPWIGVGRSRSGPRRIRRLALLPLTALISLAGSSVEAAPENGSGPTIIDLRDLTPGDDPLIRVRGPNADNGGMFTLGNFGVPVCGGFDIDGDGFNDYAVAHMMSSPEGRFVAGQVNLVFGNGSASEEFDLEAGHTRVLKIIGAGTLNVAEMAGSEIWMGDVTGDGLGDLLICRQNLSVMEDPARIGAGALTIVVGSAALRDLAESSQALDLGSPPVGIDLFTVIGPHSFARLGIWVRTGDVDGDTTTDFVVAADQESDGESHHGALYLVLGGSHLATTATVDLASFGGTSLAGQIARITPPSGATEFHFGGTCQLGDLDGNGQAEVMASAALNRAGASIGPFGPDPSTTHGSGGAPNGRCWIIWDDNFPAPPWPAGLQIDLDAPPGAVTTLSGGAENGSFGEELLGGLDYDDDGNPEFFVGDLVGDGSPGGNRPFSGIGYVFYEAELIKGLDFNIDSPPAFVEISKIIGPNISAIGSDTVAEGDFNGDGIGDLMIGNPHADPLGREEAGTMDVFLGQPGGWPGFIDTAPGAHPPGVEIFEILGAEGENGFDVGDTLCYSAAAGDIDGDGRTDIISNEMVGNGVAPEAVDSGNLIVVPGSLLSPGRGLDFIRGDANGDGVFNGLVDALVILEHQFLAGPPPPCMEAADANDNAVFDGLNDALWVLDHQFLAGPPPASPFPECGEDPAPETSLGCGEHPGCP